MEMLETLAAGLFALLVVLFLGQLFIPKIKKMEFGQNIRKEGPESHYQKAGTPTMGGILVIVSILITSIIFLDLNREVLLLLFLTISYGAIGFVDDYLNIVLRRNLGLKAKQKLALQILLALIFSIIFYLFINDTSLNLVIFDKVISLSWAYYLLLVFILVGTTNAVNLTDGLDGLLSGIASIVFLTFALLAFYIGNYNISLFALIMSAATFGFLCLNAHPARIFMGDTGSLAIGGAIAGIAIILKIEVMLTLVGLIFVIETLSVILQVFFFKTQNRRIFKMSPIHHHFELSGWSEWKVVLVFWLVTYLSALISILIFI